MNIKYTKKRVKNTNKRFTRKIKGSGWWPSWMNWRNKKIYPQPQTHTQNDSQLDKGIELKSESDEDNELLYDIDIDDKPENEIDINEVKKENDKEEMRQNLENRKEKLKRYKELNKELKNLIYGQYPRECDKIHKTLIIPPQYCSLKQLQNKGDEKYNERIEEINKTKDELSELRQQINWYDRYIKYWFSGGKTKKRVRKHHVKKTVKKRI
jgi:hypothetical protein